jgi:hypothetical protein
LTASVIESSPHLPLVVHLTASDAAEGVARIAYFDTCGLRSMVNSGGESAIRIVPIISNP